MVSIDVMTVFKRKTLKPVKFKYGGRTHKVAKILYAWVTREGGFPVHHFSVMTDDENRFEILLNTYTMDWVLDEAGLEPPEGGEKNSSPPAFAKAAAGKQRAQRRG